MNILGCFTVVTHVENHFCKTKLEETEPEVENLNYLLIIMTLSKD